MTTIHTKNIRIPLKDSEIELVFVEKGTFSMGSTEDSSEQPVHKVEIQNDFWIGKYPVTQAQWQAVVSSSLNDRLSNPSGFKGANLPVEQVSWNDIKNEFLPKLQSILDAEKLPYTCHLPSEVQWEYAARGGKDFCHENLRFSGSNRLEELAWYEENSQNQTQPVGLKMPNQLGIYDLSGNVWEWCEDDWHNNYTNAPKDERAWLELSERGAARVLRGGGWGSNEQYCRVSYRYCLTPAFRYPDMGFRILLLQSV